MRKPIVIFILIILIVIGIPVFFMIYEANLAYYVEEDYNRLSRWIFIPLVALLVLIITQRSIEKDLKRGTFEWKQYLKQLPWFVFGMAMLYFTIGTFFSSMLLFLNSAVGTPENYVVKGKVIDKVKSVPAGKSGASYGFTVRNDIDQKIYMFTTDWREIDKYNLNDPFEKIMKKGFFGFVYLN